MVTLCLRAGKAVSLVVLLIALLFPIPKVISYVHPQEEAPKQDYQRQADRTEDRVEALDARVKGMEDLHIESKLAKIETTVEDDHHILFGMAVVIFLTGLDALFRNLPKRKTDLKSEQRG